MSGAEEVCPALWLQMLSVGWVVPLISPPAATNFTFLVPSLWRYRFVFLVLRWLYCCQNDSY